MLDGTPISVEVQRSQEHPLEGRVLIHGFVGNIEKPETETITQVIQKAALVTPSKRELSDKERQRSTETPFDRDRICFHTWNDKDQVKDRSYIGNAVWAAPVQALENTIVGDDIANGTHDVFAYREGGVEISLDQGLLFISDDLITYGNIRSAIESRAQQEGKQPFEWIKKNIVVVPKDIFNDPDKLYNLITTRIEPARNVSAEFVRADQMDTTERINFVRQLESSFHPATKDQLGNASKLEGSPISNEVISEWHQQFGYYWRKFIEIGENIMDDPLRIDELRDSEYMYDGGWFFQELQRKVSLLAPDSQLMNELNDVNTQRLRLLDVNEQLLEEKYHDAPTQEQLSQLRRKPGYGNFDTYVYRDHNGKLRVHKSIF